MNILILYGSLEGQTEKISDRIATIIRNHGHIVTILSTDELASEYSLDKYDAAIIGGSIHMGKYPKNMIRFVTEHHDWLNSAPSAFFTVCMAVHSKHAKAREEAIRYGENFTAKTGWQPKLSETFAGAVKYTQYNFVTRFIMKLISKKEGGSTDTSKDHEYTDWESVEHFAEKLLAVFVD